MNLEHYRASLSTNGVAATLLHGAYRAANRLTRLAVWNGIAIHPDDVTSRICDDPRRSRVRMLDAQQMRAYSASPEMGLTDAFLARAVQRGDRCSAVFDGPELASYGWYSTRPMRLAEVDLGLELRFDPSYAYVYHGFTHPTYRGQRLHALGMLAALECMAEEGRKGLVSYVDSSNYPSLKSCLRMGYSTFGHVLIVRVGRHYVCRSTPGCGAYGFHVEHAPS